MALELLGERNEMVEELEDSIAEMKCAAPTLPLVAVVFADCRRTWHLWRWQLRACSALEDVPDLGNTSAALCMWAGLCTSPLHFQNCHLAVSVLTTFCPAVRDTKETGHALVLSSACVHDWTLAYVCGSLLR